MVVNPEDKHVTAEFVRQYTDFLAQPPESTEVGWNALHRGVVISYSGDKLKGVITACLHAAPVRASIHDTWKTVQLGTTS